jgi:hypothetical protein
VVGDDEGGEQKCKGQEAFKVRGGAEPVTFIYLRCKSQSARVSPQGFNSGIGHIVEPFLSCC